MSPRLRSRDARFLAFVLANVLGIGFYVAEGLEQQASQSGGWRRVDLELVQQRIREGKLSQREAEWYRPAPADGGAP